MAAMPTIKLGNRSLVRIDFSLGVDSNYRSGTASGLPLVAHASAAQFLRMSGR